MALSGCGDLVAFGIKPQAILADPSVVEKYKQYFEGVEILEYSQPYNVEEIMKYEPELIVYQMMIKKILMSFLRLPQLYRFIEKVLIFLNVQAI